MGAASTPGPRLQEAKQGLPITAARQQLVDMIRDCQSLVLVGETGSGKTTQLPQFLLQAGLAQACLSAVGSATYKPSERTRRQLLGCVQGGCIAVTQPRRVAATAVAARVAKEMGVQLGAEVTPASSWISGDFVSSNDGPMPGRWATLCALTSAPRTRRASST